MKRARIGVDIDGVIADLGTALLPLLSEVCGRPLAYQDICSWDIGRALNIDKETMEDTWDQVLNGDLLRHAPAIEGAVAGLSALSKHEVWLITSRPTSSRNITLAWLHDNGINYDHIVFADHGRKLSVGPTFDMFVEDSLEEATIIAESGILTILFDQPWNNMSPLPRNCKRVYSWSDILEVLGDLGKP